jgi:hypothetical protein
MSLLMLVALLLASAGPSLAAIATTSLQVHGTVVVRAQLLTSQTATTDGEWIDVSGLSAMSVHIAGITTATVEIDGSNADTRPANNTHGIKLNAVDITADQFVMLTLNLRWLKVRVPAYTSGTIQAYLEGHARGR